MHYRTHATAYAAASREAAATGELRYLWSSYRGFVISSRQPRSWLRFYEIIHPDGTTTRST